MNNTAKAWTTTPLVALVSAGLPALCPPTVQAAPSMSPEQAAHAAFPEADRFDTRSLRLSSEQLHNLDAVAPVRQRGEVRLIDAWAGTRLIGTLYIDDVIGKVEWVTYALALAADGSVRSLEILEYRETHGFEVRTPSWRKQFSGRRVDTPFRFGEDIKNISGATLSCAHLTAGVQRLMALHTQLAKTAAR
ncbi:FMN-binding protein [Zoogloea sp.]|uniref:FMN-binding protein n=1 Tax=Zoogloea sp. TaxID=49181 RepID=UPI001415E722|nr:MAG: FMN-binding protein [Zoogloea sp.]